MNSRSFCWFMLGLSGYTMIWFTRKIAAARATNPILEVFSLRCGVSAMMDAGIAMDSLVMLFSLCVVLKRLNRDIKMRVIGGYKFG